MAYHYSDPFRASDPYTQPDIETFTHEDEGPGLEPGWYWWSCFPGCLPSGDPYGPFPTEQAALKDARAKEGMFL